MKKLYLLLLVFISLNLYAHNWNYEWTYVEPKNINFNFLTSVQTKEGRIIAATDKNWICESTDFGKTFDFVFKMRDFGECTKGCIWYYDIKFAFAKDSLHGICSSISKNFERSVLGNIINYTEDGGHTWKESETTFTFEDEIMCVAWQNNNIAWLITCHTYSASAWSYEMWKSENGGKNWVNQQLITFGIRSRIPVFMAFTDEKHGYIFMKGVIYSTNDGAKNWNTENVADLVPANMMQFGNGKVLLVGTANEEFEEMDTHEWGRFINVPMGHDEVEALSDLRFGSVWVRTNSDVAVSVDSGRTWRSTILNFDQYHEYHDTLLTGLKNGKTTIFKNGGKLIYNYSENISDASRYVKPDGNLFIPSPDPDVNGGGKLLYSDGDNWNVQKFDHHLYSIKFFDNDLAYMLGFNSFYKTTNGGKDWISVYEPEGKNNISSCVCNDGFYMLTPEVGFIAGHSTGGTSNINFKTTNGGKTWEQIISGYIGVFTNENDGLFVKGNQFVYTNDGGRTWYPKSYQELGLEDGGLDYMGYICYPIANKFLIWEWSAREYIYLLDNDLKNLKKINPTFKNEETYNDGVYVFDDSTIIINTNYKPTIPDSLIISRDLGETWERVGLEKKLYDPEPRFSSDRNFVYDYFYKGVRKVSIESYDLQLSADSLTITGTITDDTEDETYPAYAVIKYSETDSVILNPDLRITCGKPFTISLPEKLKGDFELKIIPHNTQTYQTVTQFYEVKIEEVPQPEPPTPPITDAIDEIQVNGGSVHCNCGETKVYNMNGQEIKNQSLQPGVYIVRCGKNPLESVVIE